MRLVIAGGGTGGHLFPGLALAEELLSRGNEHSVLFMGAQGGMEERVVAHHGYQIELMPSLKGGMFTLDAPRKFWRFGKGYLQARRALLNFHAQAVVGLGGYASALPVVAAWGVEVPAMQLEQNVIPGRTTRFLSHFVSEVGMQFSEAAQLISNPVKAKHIGNPLRRRVREVAAKCAERNLNYRPIPEEPHVLVLGGSQGARFLNELMVSSWPKLKKAVPGVRVTLVAGKDDGPRAEDAFAAAGMRGTVVGFTEAMEDLYANADMVVARAGATSLAEISACALPSVLIPYPHAADDHQSANARVYNGAGAAWLMPQRDLEHERFAQRVADILLQPERRKRMAQAAYELARPSAAAEVIDRLLNLAGQRAAEPMPMPATA